MARMVSALVLLALVGVAGLARAAEQNAAFPFHIPPDGVVEGTAPALLAGNSDPAGAKGFVRVDGDRFVLGGSGEEIRFWGTNLCFQGCFPPHEVADRMARRLASLGFNCVRFHHMDRAGYPRGIWREGGWGDFEHTDFHPEALDRLDYLVARLKQNGIYTNLNLHVSREYGPADGFPEVGPEESIPKLGKGIDNYYPHCIREQKRYARMLLRHINPYTGTRYAEEPAVAMVEINNENSLLLEWSNGRLDRLPEPYHAELERQWNTWLRQAYASTSTLRQAWSAGVTAGGTENLLTAPGIQGRLATHGNAQARAQKARGNTGGPAREVTVLSPSPVLWHVQYSWAGFAVEKGTTYQLRIRMRANRQDTVSVSCMMNHEPWRNLGLNSTVAVGPRWREYTFFFRAIESDAPKGDSGGARITLGNLSKQDLEVAFTEPVLRPAAVHGMLPGEELGSVQWPGRELDARTPAVGRDTVRFLRDTEAGYWREMRRYLHADLGVQMPVTGTQAHFTSPYVAAETGDFVDAHTYWQHPRFPGKPWDRNNWYVQNDPMVRDPEGATVGRLASRRVFGLPYTVTEYNHPQPQHYNAEGFPTIAAWGAQQAWNGLFQFTYCSGDDWEADQFASYFDLKADPVKLAEMPACSAVFRRRLVAPAMPLDVRKLDLPTRLGLLLERGPREVHAGSAGLSATAWQRARVGLDAGFGEPSPVQAAGGRIEWRDDAIFYDGPAAGGIIGFVERKRFRTGPFTIVPGKTELDGFSVILWNRIQDASGRHLVTAVTRGVNRGMGWNEERNSVGTDWGRGPTLCRGVPFQLEVSDAAGGARVYALRADGTRAQQVSPGGRGSVYFLGPAYRTLWYEVLTGAPEN